MVLTIRAFVSVARTSGSDALVGWQGRILLLPLLAAAPALVLGVMAALPTTTGLVRRGGWGLAFGVVASFLAVWIALSPVVVWVYRVVGRSRPDWLSTWLVGSTPVSATVWSTRTRAAWVAGIR